MREKRGRVRRTRAEREEDKRTKRYMAKRAGFYRIQKLGQGKTCPWATESKARDWMRRAQRSHTERT